MAQLSCSICFTSISGDTTDLLLFSGTGASRCTLDGVRLRETSTGIRAVIKKPMSGGNWCQGGEAARSGSADAAHEIPPAKPLSQDELAGDLHGSNGACGDGMACGVVALRWLCRWRGRQARLLPGEGEPPGSTLCGSMCSASSGVRRGPTEPSDGDARLRGRALHSVFARRSWRRRQCPCSCRVPRSPAHSRR